MINESDKKILQFLFPRAKSFKKTSSHSFIYTHNFGFCLTSQKSMLKLLSKPCTSQRAIIYYQTAIPLHLNL